jgi:poly-gamma-glutamate synthesis protein (capsule biosynthesis protein)
MRKAALFILAALILCFTIPALGETSPGDILTLSFVGDLSIGDKYSSMNYDLGYAKTVDKNGLDWPFSLVRPLLDADDVTVANLEVVFTTKKKQANKDMNLIADPKYAQVLLQSGVDVVNTANNHSYDFLSAGYQESMKTLDSAGIPHFGTISPGSDSMADKILAYDIKGIKIGFVGFTYPQDSDLNRIIKRIQTLRDQGCSLVIASLHWGRELHTTPSSWQYVYAKKILDAGADVIYGHHPHILQPVQFYKGKPIFYSLGNFTFGTMGRADPDTGIFQLRYSLTKDGLELANFTVIPCRTQGTGDYRPYELKEEAERKTMLKKLVFRRETKGMQNLPESFIQTGSVDFISGEMVK